MAEWDGFSVVHTILCPRSHYTALAAGAAPGLRSAFVIYGTEGTLTLDLQEGKLKLALREEGKLPVIAGQLYSTLSVAALTYHLGKSENSATLHCLTDSALGCESSDLFLAVANGIFSSTNLIMCRIVLQSCSADKIKCTVDSNVSWLESCFGLNFEAPLANTTNIDCDA